MIPIRFGTAPRQLFGLHQPPAEGGRGHCVVLCNPFGQEAIRCHRLMRVLSERLARAGFHVLRFDYYATGDSDGDDADGDLARWTADVLAAADEARTRGGCERHSWFGLRLGATLAAMASAQAPSAPQRLILWDPVVDGRAYLEELGRYHALEMATEGEVIRPRGAAPASMREVLGFPLGEALHRQIGAITPDAFAGARAGRVGVLHSPGAREVEALRAAVGVPFEARALQSQVVWASDEAMNTSIVPADALAAIVAMVESGA